VYQACYFNGEDIDPDSGIQYEHYNVTGVYERLADACADYSRSSRLDKLNADILEPNSPETNLFVLFEKEFGRPLSPMECETISGWLDQDKYPEPLILTALKESVFAGKVHFRYIDRILLEWNRNRIQTPEEAKEYAARFRGRG
jgi:DNA replication protein